MTTTEEHGAEDAIAAWAGPSLPPTDGPLTLEELQLAGRNRGMPLEALRYDVTPVGMHYLLVHFDIPLLEASSWKLHVGGKVRKPLVLDLEDLGAAVLALDDEGEVDDAHGAAGL